MPSLEKNYIATGKVLYIFWNLPLSSIHPQAQISAEAVECASLQGKFWPMHNLVFQNQNEWAGKANARDILLGYGAKVGLDEAAYRTCLTEGQMAQKVKDDAAFAGSVGIGGTPFFVFNSNGKLYALSGAYPYDNFRQALDSLLQESP